MRTRHPAPSHERPPRARAAPRLVGLGLAAAIPARRVRVGLRQGRALCYRFRLIDRYRRPTKALNRANSPAFHQPSQESPPEPRRGSSRRWAPADGDTPPVGLYGAPAPAHTGMAGPPMRAARSRRRRSNCPKARAVTPAREARRQLECSPGKSYNWARDLF